MVLPQLFVRCYTDSQVALCWILGTTKEWKPFVNNRVKEIRTRVSPSQWSHCPGSSNPADLPSRGMTSLELSVSLLWRRGSNWLQCGFDPSPQDQSQDIPEECLTEFILKGQDGLTRAATVKVASSDQRTTILKRPVQLLYPLEISSETYLAEGTTNSDCATEEVSEETPHSQTRPRRVAAQNADAIRRACMEENEDDL